MAEPAKGRGILHLARRAGWSVADQALSSLSNLVLALLVARAVDADGFGAFTVAFAVYSSGVLLSRTLVSQPLAVRFAGADRADYRRAVGMSTGTAVVLGLAGGVAVVLVGALLAGPIGGALAAVGLALPGLLLHDAWRMAFIIQGRPERAVLLDVVSIALQVGAVVWLLQMDVDDPVPFVLGWGAAASLASVVGVALGPVLPRLSRTRRWLRAHWDLTRYLLSESVLVQGAFQGALLLVGVFATLRDVGALRGAAVVVGPVSLLAMSAQAFGIPELARRTGLSVRRQRLAAALIGGLLAAIGAAWGLLVLAMPESVGEYLLGDSWPGVQPILLPTVLGQVVNLISVGAICVIMARAQVRTAFLINGTVAVLLVGLGVLGAWLAGAAGAAWGFTAAYATVMPIWIWSMLRASRPSRQPLPAIDPARVPRPDGHPTPD
mgnify:CR=1 FL=1